MFRPSTPTQLLAASNTSALLEPTPSTKTAGELRYDLIDNPTGADYTIISMDVNGDGVADSQITLVGLITLGQGDFIFGP